jgi:molecular chaperone GrpE
MSDTIVEIKDPQSPQDEAAAPPEEATGFTADSDRVAELEGQLSAERDRALRFAADMDNLRKRSRKEVEEALGRGRGEVLLEILPVIDSIDSALSSAAETEGSAAAVLEGVTMVRRQFLSAVERFGVTPIEAVGQAFDPNFHEAVAQVHSDDHEVGQIVHEMRKGYVMGEKLLRASMVVVSKGSSSSRETPESTEPLQS